MSLDIVAAFPTVFSGFGKIAKFVHCPRVNPQVKHVSQGLRCFLLSVRDEVLQELKRLQDDGVLSNQSTHHTGFQMLLLYDENQVKQNCVRT